MEFAQEDDNKKGRYYLKEDLSGNTEITYVYAGPDKIIISHTGVSEVYKGQSVGKQLVNVVADFARTNNIKIIPLCPFAKAIMSRDVTYNDVLS